MYFANYHICTYLLEHQLAPLVDDFMFHLLECGHAFHSLKLSSGW